MPNLLKLAVETEERENEEKEQEVASLEEDGAEERGRAIEAKDLRRLDGGSKKERKKLKLEKFDCGQKTSRAFGENASASKKWTRESLPHQPSFPILSYLYTTIINLSMAAASVSYHDISLDSASSRRVHLNSSSPNQQHLQADLHDMNRVHPLPSGSPDGAGDCKEGAYHIPRPSECLMSWDEICQVSSLGRGRLREQHSTCFGDLHSAEYLCTSY